MVTYEGAPVSAQFKATHSVVHAWVYIGAAAQLGRPVWPQCTCMALHEVWVRYLDPAITPGPYRPTEISAPLTE